MLPTGLSAMPSPASVCPSRTPTARNRVTACSVGTTFRSATSLGLSERYGDFHLGGQPDLRGRPTIGAAIR
jgi:hypothetical protein